MTTSAWYLGQIQDLLARGFHGKIIIHVQAGNVERLVKEESILAPLEVRNGNNGQNGRKNTENQK